MELISVCCIELNAADGRPAAEAETLLLVEAEAETLLLVEAEAEAEFNRQW